MKEARGRRSIAKSASRWQFSEQEHPMRIGSPRSRGRDPGLTKAARRGTGLVGWSVKAAILLAAIPLLSSLSLAQTALPALPAPLLTPAEKRMAVELAAPVNLVPFGIDAPADASRRVVTGVLSVASKSTDASQRPTALVILFDYEQRATLRALVDVAAGSVIGVTRTTDDTPPLARSEYVRAQALALGDSRVREALASFAGNVRAEAGVSLITDRQDQLYGHRVARVLFRTDAGYVRTPFAVYVDLTDSIIHLR
jgi:hypothetical protein